MNDATNIAWTLTLLLATCRAAGVLLVAPPFAAMTVPLRLRVAMALVLGVAVLGRLFEPAMVAPAPASLLAAVVMELGMGLVIGLGVRLIFTGMAIGAWHVATQMGLTIGELADPSAGQNGGPLQRLLVVGAIAVFVLLDGHMQLAAALMGTYETLPLGAAWQPLGLLKFVVGLLGSSFLLALKVAAPVLLALIVVTVVLGVVQRSMPQLHVFNMGLPARALLGLIVLGGAVAALVPLTDQAWQITQRALSEAVSTGAKG
ncbi:MAG: hypothetical protein GVY16_03070 [Planctomycetes bacterium]|jgi:flagellar biosynthetic protein FliR|nr:hypothetical protein [Planctomycetota bacterium]